MSLAKLIAPDIEELIREKPEALAAAVAELHPADLAELLDDLPREDRLVLFEALPPEQGAAVLSELKGETLRLVLHQASLEKLGPQLDRVPGDEVVFLLEHVSQRRRESLLGKMSPRDAAEAKRLLRYEPGTAGRLMNEKFAKVRPEWTVGEALEHLKKIDPEVETIQTIYAVDGENHLVGAVALRKLLPQPPDRKIGELLERRVVSVRTDTPQEEVAKAVSKYDVFAIPVVDAENHPVGIVTVDDVIDVLSEVQTEDVLHMGGVTAEEEPEGYFARSPIRNVRLRFNWLLLLFVTETLTGTVLRHFEDELAKVVALSFFIPLLIGTGGNSGSQTVTTIVRGLAVGEIKLRDFARVFVREAGSGLVLGLLLGVVGFGRALLWGSTMPLAWTVGVSILAICTWANAVGASIPMLATLFKIDPTVMSAPLIATLVDATGLFIYFAIARIFLGL
ncbi:MAG TPA: magnesium transporter [Thermoanaerobaculia bacterium]|nr:magnesium transporter [Thermoanaerobaculia bacterium]